MAGLIVGTWARGLDCQVHGYTVLWPQPEAITRLEGLLEETRRQYFPAVTGRPSYQILGSQLGTGYGAPTAAGLEASRLAGRHDGLLLDHTYTAKAMAGLIQGIRDGTYTHQDRVVFFHTGGGGILRSRRQRRLTAPNPGNSSTDRTAAGMSRRNRHAMENGHARRPRSRRRRTYRPFCVRPDGRADSYRGRAARRAGKTHGRWLAGRVGASWQCSFAERVGVAGQGNLAEVVTRGWGA
jgi:hypothetical protein